MTPTQAKLATRLYRAYKTETREYRQLAEALGINTAELNRRCWHIVKGRPYR
jgi:hypothetical protein